MSLPAISDEQAQFFLDNGYLILREAIHGEELARVRAAMDELTAYGSAEVRHDPDFSYGDGHLSGAKVLRRIEYVIDKRDECKVLLGNPFVLRSVEKLMGPDLIPTWDSMVLKLPGEGIEVPWHRDAGTDKVGDRPIFNVDFYLDEADEDTCVWVVPGSHLWDKERADAAIAVRRGYRGFDTSEAVPALMQPGDVLLHNILVLHGSPPNQSKKLRRVVYYEFRTAHVEQSIGPHVPDYIPLKQAVLLRCIDRRRKAGYTPSDEVSFSYNPPAPFETHRPDGEIPTYRYSHKEYWRET